MNKSQRMVAGIVLILMGVISFILVVLIVHRYSGYYFRKYMSELYPLILLGIAFMGAGIFVLIGEGGIFKKRPSRKVIKIDPKTGRFPDETEEERIDREFRRDSWRLCADIKALTDLFSHKEISEREFLKRFSDKTSFFMEMFKIVKREVKK